MNESTTITQIEVHTGLKKHIKRIERVTYFSIKRLFDIFASLLGIIFLLPIACIVKICSLISGDTHSILFTQNRIGKNGEEFKFYKFRSMVPNADEVLEVMLKDKKIKEEYKKNMKLSNDPRITKIGTFLRKTSIDELPQLINVLKGDMSMIGNRPYLPREKEDMKEYYNDIIKSKPGITGYWQVSGRSNISFKERCKLESFYSNNNSFKLDTKIFFKTFYVVLFKKGAE